MHRSGDLLHHLGLASLTVVVLVFQPLRAATDDNGKSAGSAAVESATAQHLSSLATTGPKPTPITPPEPAAITSAIDRGLEFLLADQRPDGSWGSPENTKGLNIYAPVPGAHDAFRTGVTSLVIMALVEAEPKLEGELKTKAATAIDRGANWLDEKLGRLRRATPDALYNIWGHAYSMQALVRLHQRATGNVDKQTRFRDLAQSQADLLARYSFVGGGWSYYDFLAGTQTPGDAAFSFCTATALIAINEGKTIGVEFPERLITKAIASIHRQQKPDFSYAYGEYLRMMPMKDINRPGGSLGRSQVCNLALRLYDDPRVTDEVLKTWLDRLFARNGWLSIGRKRPIPHEAHFGVAGYFYYYGHWYAAMCIDKLPEAERPYFQDHLAHIILPHQERDGSWWDYPFYNYHQQYGTAMAIMTLLRCQRPS
ncbi:MAG: terpene cyclase/mutase family protein [Planctomycetes bacterium]|nr:terpene cyclase/mutase family protein [Planctomycetota bacterium]